MATETVYARYSAYRKPAYRLMTLIEKNSDKLVVTKISKNEESLDHLASLVNKYNKLAALDLPFELIQPDQMDNKATFDYIPGLRLDKKVIDLAIEDKLDELHSVIDMVLSAIDSLSKKNVKNTDYTDLIGNTFTSDTTHIKIGYFDFNLDNFIEYKDSIYLIDYEWLFDFSLPISFVQSRFFYYLTQQLSQVYKTKASEACPVIGIGDHGFIHEKTYERYKKYLKHLPETYIAEQHLQNYVKVNESPIDKNSDFTTYSRHTQPIYPSLINRAEHNEHRSQEQHEENTALRKQLSEASKELEATKHELQIATAEIHRIKSSKAWRALSKARRTLTRR